MKKIALIAALLIPLAAIEPAQSRTLTKIFDGSQPDSSGATGNSAYRRVWYLDIDSIKNAGEIVYGNFFRLNSTSRDGWGQYDDEGIQAANCKRKTLKSGTVTWAYKPNGRWGERYGDFDEKTYDDLDRLKSTYFKALCG